MVGKFIFSFIINLNSFNFKNIIFKIQGKFNNIIIRSDKINLFIKHINFKNNFLSLPCLQGEIKIFNQIIKFNFNDLTICFNDIFSVNLNSIKINITKINFCNENIVINFNLINFFNNYFEIQNINGKLYGFDFFIDSKSIYEHQNFKIENLFFKNEISQIIIKKVQFNFLSYNLNLNKINIIYGNNKIYTSNAFLIDNFIKINSPIILENEMAQIKIIAKKAIMNLDDGILIFNDSVMYNLSDVEIGNLNNFKIDLYSTEDNLNFELNKGEINV